MDAYGSTDMFSAALTRVSKRKPQLHQTLREVTPVTKALCQLCNTCTRLQVSKLERILTELGVVQVFCQEAVRQACQKLYKGMQERMFAVSLTLMASCKLSEAQYIQLRHALSYDYNEGKDR